MTRRRRWLGLVVIGLGGALWARTAEPSGAAHAVHAAATFVDDIALEAHDFGRLVGPQTRTATLAHVNDTDEAWELRRTWSECGCVELASASERVEPGASATFELHIDTAGQAGGPLTRHAYALYDPGPRRITLAATAVIAPRPYPVPHRLDVELAGDDSAWREDAWIESPFEFATLELVASEGEVAVAVAAPEPSELGTRLPFVCSGTLPQDVSRRVIDLTFAVFGDPDRAEGEEVHLRGTIRRVPPLTTSPRVLVLNGDSDVLRGRVWLRSADGTWPPRVEVGPALGDECAVTYDPRDGSLAIEARATSAGTSTFRLRAAAPSGAAVEFPVRVDRGRRFR